MRFEKLAHIRFDFLVCRLKAFQCISWMIIPAVFLVAISNPITAQTSAKEMNVQWLYTACKEPQSSSLHDLREGFCLGFISGIAHQMFWTGRWLIQTPSIGKAPLVDRLTNDDDQANVFLLSACTKSNVSNGAMRQAFINWAEKHPEGWSGDSQLGVMQAIRSAWPCPPFSRR
jgi:Rap1a immunity proteins